MCSRAVRCSRTASYDSPGPPSRTSAAATAMLTGPRSLASEERSARAEWLSDRRVSLGSAHGQLPGRHPQRAVEPDALAVEHLVAGDVACQLRELGRLAEPVREGHGLAQAVARLL